MMSCVCAQAPVAFTRLGTDVSHDLSVDLNVDDINLTFSQVHLQLLWGILGGNLAEKQSVQFPAIVHPHALPPPRPSRPSAVAAAAAGAGGSGGLMPRASKTRGLLLTARSDAGVSGTMTGAHSSTSAKSRAASRMVSRIASRRGSVASMQPPQTPSGAPTEASKQAPAAPAAAEPKKPWTMQARVSLKHMAVQLVVDPTAERCSTLAVSWSIYTQVSALCYVIKSM
jgi:hypothetical protein